jgi:hypothetical protein
MKKDEKTIFAPRFEDGMLKQEVAQTAVSFSEHRLVAPFATEQQTRLEVGRRIIRRLAQVALGRIIALDEKAVDLQQQKGYLSTRLRMLNLARDGMEGIVDDPATIRRADPRGGARAEANGRGLYRREIEPRHARRLYRPDRRRLFASPSSM